MNPKRIKGRSPFTRRGKYVPVKMDRISELKEMLERSREFIDVFVEVNAKDIMLERIDKVLKGETNG